MTTREPTPEQLARAFAQMRLATWPWATLEQLLADKSAIDRAYALVRARAVAMAHGQVLPPAPVQAASPAPQPKPVQTPAPALAQHHRRRSDFDARAAAAGELVHHLGDDADTE